MGEIEAPTRGLLNQPETVSRASPWRPARARVFCSLLSLAAVRDYSQSRQ